DAQKAAVEPSDGPALIAHELLGETSERYAQIVLLDEFGRETRVSRELAHDLLPLRVGELRSLHQGERVFVQRESFRLRDGLGEVGLEVRSELLVVPGCRRVARQVEDVGQIVADAEVDRLEIEDARDERDSVQPHAVLVLEIARQRGRARPDVAFAGLTYGRGAQHISSGGDTEQVAARLHG